MSQHVGKYTLLAPQCWIFATLLALMVPLTSCNKSENHAVGEVQKTYASPEEASAAVIEAAKSGDETALLAIFGTQGKDALFSGDSVRDKDDLADFAAAYDQMHRWGGIKAGGKTLYVGADNYPFPIPLGQNSSGQWYFDTAAGMDEILARRIGKSELSAIAACDAIASAQQQYFKHAHDSDKVKQYAQKFVSDPGKQDGLYWEVAEDQTPSPLGQLGDFARAAGYINAGDKPQLFNGYYFRILTKQGDKAKGGTKDYVVDGKMTRGFAILAYPAEYRDSGIMTFVVGEDSVVYQKDLGDKTTEVASAMVEYNPGNSWDVVFGTEGAQL